MPETNNPLSLAAFLLSSDALYASCVEVLSLCQSMKDELHLFSIQRLGLHQDFEFVGTNGFISSDIPFIVLISLWCTTGLEENRDERAHPEELTALRMEANTWGFLQALCNSVSIVASPNSSSALPNL